MKNHTYIVRPISFKTTATKERFVTAFRIRIIGKKMALFEHYR